jgi:phage terminase large subunit GpA-like protein
MTDDTPAPSAVDEVLRKAYAGFAPPPALKISEYADRTLVVTSGPLAGTRWRTDFAPYQRGIMDAWFEPGVQTVVVMGSSQWGKTATAVNVVAYHIDHDPCSILVVEPTVDPMAKDFAKNRLDTLILAVPSLADAVSKKRQKDATNSALQKTFRGGALAIAGANSASSLASRAVRLLIGDEIDRWPAELPGEGNTIAIALKRTTTYRRRKRIFLLSSPTLKGGPIHSWYLRGDQRKYFVPCPHCGLFHTYEWANVKWEREDPKTARLECPGCHQPISEAQRVVALRRGEWRSTLAPASADGEASSSPDDQVVDRDPTIVSFHLWEAYSPLSSLAEIVRTFLRARQKQKEGDKSEMHTWQNTALGEPIEPDAGDGVDSHVLLMRREPYPDGVDVPREAVCLTAGVDTQDDRLEVLIVGWGPGEETWLIDRLTLPGDPERPEPWGMLDDLLDQEYRHPSGQTLSIQAACIDSAGHRTTFVYDYALKKAARRVFAIIGRDGDRPIVSSPSPRRWGRQQRQVPLYTIGVDAAKALLISRMALTEKGRGYLHLPFADWADDELAAQLTAERLVMRFSKGVPIQVWKKFRARNEALDCYVYALGALRLLRPNLDDLARRLSVPRSPQGPAPAPAKRPAWFAERRPGWLKRR